MVRPPRPLRTALVLCVGAVLLYAAWLGASILFLPSVLPLRDSRVSFVITVKDWNRKNHPFVVGPRNRDWTPIGAVPAAMKKAVVASEDANFFSHEGVDYEALKEAIKADIQKGKFVRGGSTITQQVAKNIYLSRERTISRKIKEIVLARRIDDALTKSRILELYLNVVELGPMVYGIGHAARYYFGKPPSALSVRECVFLAAMLPGPKVYNPYRKLGRVVKRCDRILRRMYAARMITGEQYESARAEMPNLAGLEKKVEKTMEMPPPEEKPAVEATPESLPVPGEPEPESRAAPGSPGDEDGDAPSPLPSPADAPGDNTSAAER